MNEIERLVFFFAKLPGLGPRMAKRIVMYLLDKKDIRIRGFIDLLSLVFKNAKKCECGNIDVNEVCYICSSTKRDKSVIAVVDNINDLWSIEKSGAFNGIYRVIKPVQNFAASKWSTNTQPKPDARYEKYNVPSLDPSSGLIIPKPSSNLNQDNPYVDHQSENHVASNSANSIKQSWALKSQEEQILSLVELIKRDKIQEVIIATSNNLDGQTTAFLILDKIKGLNCKISRIASGIPIGGSIDYSDESTISAAILSRQPFDSSQD